MVLKLPDRHGYGEYTSTDTGLEDSLEGELFPYAKTFGGVGVNLFYKLYKYKLSFELNKTFGYVVADEATGPVSEAEFRINMTFQTDFNSSPFE